MRRTASYRKSVLKGVLHAELSENEPEAKSDGNQTLSAKVTTFVLSKGKISHCIRLDMHMFVCAHELDDRQESIQYR